MLAAQYEARTRFLTGLTQKYFAGDEDAMNKWMATQHAALDNKAPISILSNPNEILATVRISGALALERAQQEVSPK